MFIIVIPSVLSAGTVLYNMMKNMLILLPLLLHSHVAAVGLRVDKYVHYNEMVQWKDAQDFCRKHHTDLLTIRDEEDNPHFFSTQGWIGLYRDNCNSDWKWSLRNDSAKFTLWEGKYAFLNFKGH